MGAPLIPSASTPILRREFTTLMDAEKIIRRARRLRAPETIAPEHEAKHLAVQLIDDAIAQLIAARVILDPPSEKTDV